MEGEVEKGVGKKEVKGIGVEILFVAQSRGGWSHAREKGHSCDAHTQTLITLPHVMFPYMVHLCGNVLPACLIVAP